MKVLFACLLVLFVSVSALPTNKDVADCEEALCFIHPCAFVTCPAYPDAKCKPNYCGGCHAQFYVNEKEVQC